MRTYKIGQIQTIDIRIHLSMVLVGFWAIYRWGFAADGGLTGIVYGLLLVTGIFALVLIHELGHGVMAHQYGLQVRDVTILPFGGVARVEQMPANSRVESMVALAGPLTNFALAAATLPVLLLWIVASGQSPVGVFAHYQIDTPSFGGLVLYLYLANLLLAIANLLPIFPMDGGRILRASLSGTIGRDLATRAAVFATAIFSVVAGAFALANGELLIAIACLMLIGIALAEGRAVRIEQQLMRLQVGQFAVWDRGGVGPTDPLALALRDGPRDIVVTAHGAVLGMLWKADLQRALQSGALHKRAGELMDSRIVTADAQTSVWDVHTLMAANNQWALPITENGTYRGMFNGERFSHVHHVLRSRTPESRHVAAFTGSVSQALRGLVR